MVNNIITPEHLWFLLSLRPEINHKQFKHMKQIAQSKPTKVSDLDFKTNAFNARTFAGALVASKNYFQTVFGYKGEIKNTKAFQDGNQIVYRFYTTENHEAYFVF